MNNIDQRNRIFSCNSDSDRSSGLRVSRLAICAFFLAYSYSASAESSPAGSTPSDSPSASAADIVVTAQRRSQRVVDVPYNITAVSADGLASAGVSNANDLTKVVGGLGNFSDGPADRFGENNFSLRGLRADPAGPNRSIRYSVNSVSTYYGDVPVFFPVLMKDIERVEVLRGPQGTLYGSGAQAGAIRFIPTRPQFDKLSVETNASTGITQHARGLNASVDGVVNFPLADNLALRVSAAYIHQAGFIDQVGLIQLDPSGVPVPSIPGDITSGPVLAPVKKGTNSSEQWMARAALRYKPTDWLDLDLAYLHQEATSKDSQVTNPAFGGGLIDLSSGTWPNGAFQSRAGGRYDNTKPILQPVNAKVDLITGTAAFDAGFSTVSSITSYYNSRVHSVTDVNIGYVTSGTNLLYYYNYYPRFVGFGDFEGRERGFTQEFRIVSQGQSPFTYVLGAYYQRQTREAHNLTTVPGLYAFSQAACATGYNAAYKGCQLGANPQIPDVTFSKDQNFVTKDIAAFGELTYHLTPRWQVTGGMRIFKATQNFDALSLSPFVGADFGDGSSEPMSQGANFASNKASSSRSIFKFNTSYDLDNNNKVYMTFAQGYRRGGANPLTTSGPNASLPKYLNFKPDIANNYEIGIKGLTFNRRLTYALSAYRIDVKDFQFLGSTAAGISAVFNGEKAVSKGIELEAGFRVSPQLTLSGSYSYIDAKVAKTTVIEDYALATLLNDPTPVIVVNPGARLIKGAILPGVSKHTALAAVDYEIRLPEDQRIILHANASYRSKQNSQISTTNARFAVIPEVFSADARITYDSGKGWSGSLFVTNITNTYGSSGTLGAQRPNVPVTDSLLYSGKIIQTPRTFGIDLHYGF